ncbi:MULTISPECIES: alpha/beta hydrolase [unclassified Novosphingobium]|uniref:alpha/beta fold hydrolase n=1 Tax=unclassified Novosphingobium TaxID=2644732 RepID=UPI0025D118F6|nr:MULTISPECIES: alpha/beta hydrolase [unclassified Novosphingobium]HQV03708.1 alpha/beta hydrolase [Novosphingobium sp.]
MKRAFKWICGLFLVALIALFAIGYTPDTGPAAMRAKYASPASQFVDIGGGVTMHVRDEGKRDGPVLVLLHGSNASLHTWEPWVARLGAKYRIISLDQIGHGLTGPNPTGQYDAPAFVGTLDALLNKLGVNRFALAGNSMGGYVAWEYALAHPDKLTHLVLVDAAGPPDDPNKQLPIGFRIARTPGFSKLALIITPRSVFEKSLHGSVSNHAIVTPAAIDRYWELNRYPGNRAATGARFAQYGTRNRNVEAIGSIKVPTLILWGAEDKLIPANGADWFAQRIAGSTKIVYPGIGHLPMEEAPDRSAADLDAFLSKPFPSPAKPSSIATIKP